jgi:hypothetical protein
MGKKRKPSWNSNAYDDDLVDDNPFVEGLFALMDSEAENLSVHGSFWESLGGFHRVESGNGI